MKTRLFNFFAVLIALIAMSGCNKEMETSNESIPGTKAVAFEFTASPASTKTTNDGLKTKWAANDGVNFFHAETGTSNYVSDNEFTIAEADLSANNFKGNLSEALSVGKYDWYMVYPYNQYLLTPANNSDSPARYYIGSRSDQSQVQTGNNSMAHLAGTNYPLYGMLTGVESDVKPTIAVNHVASYLEIKVTNKNESPLTVESVSFTAPDGEKLVGYFNIDFTAEPMAFTMYQTYASETATLTVNNGAEIAKDQTASFFLGIKPFSLESGVLNVSVNGYTKEIPINKLTTFSAGRIKKINFSYDKEEYVFSPEQFELANSVSPGDRIILTNGTTGMLSVMKHYEGGNNNYKKVDATVSSDGTITSTEDMAVLTVGGQSDALTLFDESTMLYLDATSTTSSNYLKSSQTLNDYTQWNISFGNDKNAIITNTGKTTRNIIRYNSANDQLIFSCYSSGQKPVYIFKVAVPLVLDHISLDYSACKTEFEVNESFTYEGLTVSATYTDGSTRIVAPTSVSLPDMTTTGTKTVSVTYTEGDISKVATYEISVIPTIDWVLKDIFIAKAPNKTSYSVGDFFSPEGLEVKSTLVDANNPEREREEVIGNNDLEFTPALNTPLTTDISSITIRYQGKTTTQPITVSAENAWPTTYTSNIELSTSGGTSATTAKVIISKTEYAAIKAGTGNVAGAMKVTVPQGSTHLHVHAAGWNGESVTLKVTIGNQTIKTIKLISDTGVKSNTPFTLAGEGSKYYFDIPLSDTGISEDKELVFTATNGNRFVIWGVNAK